MGADRAVTVKVVGDMHVGDPGRMQHIGDIYRTSGGKFFQYCIKVDMCEIKLLDYASGELITTSLANVQYLVACGAWVRYPYPLPLPPEISNELIKYMNSKEIRCTPLGGNQ